MSETLRIAKRFHGPPNSGNGGYVCGVLARVLGGPAEVTLRAPPPLETPLTLTRQGREATLRDGETEIARAYSAKLTLTPPPAPSLAEAERAAARYPGLAHHFFPTCFTCGPAHAEGLHVFTGPWRESFVAAPWTPSADLDGGYGQAAEEFVWAALDCPTYWALPAAGAFRAVLGRFAADVAKRPRVGEPAIVAAWPISSSGRKHRAAAALYDLQGGVLARAEATWIAIKPEQFT